jgi:gas vesicle structural protein
MAGTGNRYAGGPSPSGLADVLELILDKGLVVDAYARISLAGIELVTIDARIVVASVDTYLRFAEAVGRLSLEETGNSQGLPELVEGMTENGAKSKTSGAIEGAKEKLGFGDDDDDRDRGRDDDGHGNGRSRTRRRSSSSSRMRRSRDDDDD